ncbi:MAG TPA: protein kinase [Ktedonobacteraceae bacterium]|nr:protein kinase [Ktedonobacteraceae bacterium]
METGRVINRRYLLQRLIKHGQVCAIYQGTDQVLQRTVAIKVVPSSDITAYRAAIKLTAHFSHPNIVGLYDLVVEPEALYIIQEHIEGYPFSALLQQQLSLFEIVDIGMQISQALIYAENDPSNVCHGDLTPSAIMRDPQGLVRVNNFALPGDFFYFQSWCKMGGDDIVFSDPELPYGQQSEARRSDDIRATGLLLYQLLAGRAPGSSVVEPPPDGRLRFQRNVPAELCETVARVVVRPHPQRISTPEALYAELKALSETVAQPLPMGMLATSDVYQPPAEPLIISQAAPSSSGKLASALPVHDTDQPGLNPPAYRSDQSMQLPLQQISPASPTVADVSMKLAAARQAAYPESVPQQPGRRSLLPILLIGLIVFVLLFIIGYFAGHFLVP